MAYRLFKNKELTSHQINCLDTLGDGEWHDRAYIRRKLELKKLSRSIISERILQPLELIGIIEQETRDRKKKFVRIRKEQDLLFLMDERDLYQDRYQRAHEQLCEAMILASKDQDNVEVISKFVSSHNITRNLKAYEIFDKLCRSHEESARPSSSLSPAQAEMYKIAKQIEPSCKISFENAYRATRIARPDLWQEHAEWQRKYASEMPMLDDRLKKSKLT